MSWKLQEQYERWWKGKYLENGRKIVDVDYIGNAFTGVVILRLDDGSRYQVIPRDPNAYRPRKKDLKVFDKPPEKVIE